MDYKANCASVMHVRWSMRLTHEGIMKGHCNWRIAEVAPTIVIELLDHIHVELRAHLKVRRNKVSHVSDEWWRCKLALHFIDVLVHSRAQSQRLRGVAQNHRGSCSVL